MKTTTAIKAAASIAEIMILVFLGLKYGALATISGAGLVVIGGIDMAAHLWEDL